MDHTKTVFRPFWSYDVPHTERWLAGMTERGYELIAINRAARLFSFQQTEAKQVTYRIGYEKNKPYTLPAGLTNDGWNTSVQSGKWHVLLNRKAQDQIDAFPMRESIMKHNKRIMFLSAGLFIYLTAVALLFLIIFSVTALRGETMNVVDSPMWVLTDILLSIAIVLWMLALYSTLKIRASNKRMSLGRMPKGVTRAEVVDEGKLSQSEEKQLRRAGKLIVKWKSGWMYAPDKLEKWLEDLEQQGWQLYRVSKTGTTFYFMQGTSRQMSYCADYQTSADADYFNFHREAGWQSSFISTSSIQRWTLWSREYAEGEDKPRIYSDQTDQLSHAKRIAVTYSCLFLPLTLYFITIVGTNINLYNHLGMNRLQLANLVLFVTLILVFGTYTARTWIYYWRLNRKFSHEQ
ncbi:DUF2812 domain-containing protein [Paenibacillaceae bacterium]|nr:DUF2812 domain-containing protein [Paenibacillaceae bacterium]